MSESWLTARVIPPPRRDHICMTSDFPDDVQAIGTLAACSVCGDWYRLIAHYPGQPDNSRVWKRLGFWDFRARRCVRDFEREERRRARNLELEERRRARNLEREEFYRGGGL